jgi:hypothetical protein
VVQRQGNTTIVNSARNIELPELKSNAAMREDLASWIMPKPIAQTPENGPVTPPQVQPNTSA